MKGITIRSKKTNAFVVQSFMNYSTGKVVYYIQGTQNFDTPEECLKYIDKLRLEEVS